MHFTPPDARERHNFIDRTIDATLDALHEPEAVRMLGPSAIEFTRTVEQLAVANIVNGEVQLPAASADDDHCLPVTVILPDEKLFTASEYEAQNNTQKQNTLKLFEKWVPWLGSAQGVYDDLCGVSANSLADRPVITTHNITEAMTGYDTRIISASERSEYFTSAPGKGITLIKRRPLLFLKMQPGEQEAQADVVVHELVHARQGNQEPVTTLHSQKSADMWILRGELEAYAIGAIVAGHRYAEVLRKGDRITPDNIDSGAVQILVEGTRRKFNTDPHDPYRPSPRLLRTLGELPIGNIIHGAISYDELTTMLEEPRS